MLAIHALSFLAVLGTTITATCNLLRCWSLKHKMHQRTLSGRTGSCSPCTRASSSQNTRCVAVRASNDLKHNASKTREVVVGIDLGTTNSAVAYIENGKPKCIPNADGQRTTPSVVCFLPDGDVLVGNRARKQAGASPDSTFYSVKRLIGRLHSDPVVAQEASRLSYQVSASWAHPCHASCGLAHVNTANTAATVESVPQTAHAQHTIYVMNS